ncbi:MAG TPA: hypothetical protein VKV57_00225 [bacterium]|nr:hypothetical protein [bacterium]
MRRVWLARMLGVMAVVAMPAIGFSYGSFSFGGKGIGIVQADDSNGDEHSNCHTGEMFLGAGGNDKIDSGDCPIIE